MNYLINFSIHQPFQPVLYGKAEVPFLERVSGDAVKNKLKATLAVSFPSSKLVDVFSITEM